MSKPRYLTKSRFKLAAECPTKLFYTGKDQVYRNLKKEDSFLAMLADGGYQVGELAKCFYPDGIEVESINHEKALAQTAELLKQEYVTIFEPAIRHGNLFVRVDILVKKGNTLELIEVKAKSYNSVNPEILGARGRILSDMRPYIEDVAFQAYVLRSAFPNATVKTFLMMPDKSVTVDISGLNQLFKIVRDGNRSKVIASSEANTVKVNHNILALVPMDEYVDMINQDGVKYLGYNKDLPLLAEEWSQAYQADRKIPPNPGSQCSSCEFKSTPGDGYENGFKECWAQTYQFTDADFEQGTVLDIYNYRKKDRLISDGRVRLSSVNEDDINIVEGGEELSLSERQWMQVRGIPAGEDRGGYWIADHLIRKEMDSWKYPYHFIDFETSTVALPFHAGMRPYEPVAFQFSHHVMHEDGLVEHVGEFLLTDPVVFPNFEFAQALKNQLDQDDGTVFMWSPHENSILNQIIKQLESTPNPPANGPELVQFIQSLVKTGERAMYDLCKLSGKAYYQVDTKGSSSIKKVLPAVLKTSAFLRQKYSQPIYGSQGGIPSKNFTNFTWWVDAGQGVPMEPYDLLKDYGSELLGETVLAGEDPDELVIANGGAAATAYARLQFEELGVEPRRRICEALLRYCELDTMAMVMIVEAWKEFTSTV